MPSLRLLTLMALNLCFGTLLWGAVEIEVYAPNSNTVSRFILEELQQKITSDERFELIDDYASSDRDAFAIGGKEYDYVDEDLSSFGFLVVLNASDASSLTSDEQTIVSLDFFSEGVLIDTDIFLATGNTEAQIADRIFTEIETFLPFIEVSDKAKAEVNRTAVSAEVSTYCTMVIQYFKTPKAQGGAGQDTSELTIGKVSDWLGFTRDDGIYYTDSGSYFVLSAYASFVEIRGELHVADEYGVFGAVTGTVDCRSGVITLDDNH